MDVACIIIKMEQFTANSHIAGYHVYKTAWTPVIGEELVGEMEPLNPEDRYAVCVKKNGSIVGHLEKGISERFSQIIFFFLRADRSASCRAIIMGHPVNLGDERGQKVPCRLIFSGKSRFIAILREQLNSLA